jgi:hypothetical protein
VTNINKKNGKVEKFDRSKIERSLKRVKVDEKTTKEIASKIIPKENMTTDEIRRTVVKELRRVNEKAAKQYENSRRLNVKRSIKAASGIVQLNKETMTMLNLRGGDTIKVNHLDKRMSFKVEQGTLGQNEINLNESDLRNIGASDGIRILVQRQI